MVDVAESKLMYTVVHTGLNHQDLVSVGHYFNVSGETNTVCHRVIVSQLMNF